MLRKKEKNNKEEPTQLLKKKEVQSEEKDLGKSHTLAGGTENRSEKKNVGMAKMKL